jgi:hypothetical protein
MREDELKEKDLYEAEISNNKKQNCIKRCRPGHSTEILLWSYFTYFENISLF